MKGNIRIHDSCENRSSQASQGWEKVVINLARSPDDPSWPPVDREGVWAKPVGDGAYEIDNVPFFAKGLARGDVIAARKHGTNEELTFDHVIKSGGHSTYRVIIDTAMDEDHHEAYHHLLNALSEFGCVFETADRILTAIDVPPATNVSAVYDVLKLGLEEGIWDFAEAHYAGPKSSN